MQSESVAAQLRQLMPGVRVELHIIKTTGDRIVDRPLHDMGGKGLFTKELELALLGEEIDFAVHSYKDVPVTMPLVDLSELVIAAVPMREDARDVLVASSVHCIDELPQAATVGTGSLRRECQLRQHRPDLQIVPIRGNIDTRLRKQRDGEMDAIVLAAAGLRRANLFDSGSMNPIPIETMVPAAGQGALALQCRASDESTRRFLKLMNHLPTQTAVNLERKLIQQLNADCHSPIGVYAKIVDENVQMQIAIGTQGSEVVKNNFMSGKIDLILEKIQTEFFKS